MRSRTEKRKAARKDEKRLRKAQTTPHQWVVAKRLVDLFWKSLPSELDASSKDDWRVVGPALVARCAMLVRSILQLRDRELDAGILTRSLWEHGVLFAWLAADPAGRLPRWRKDDAGWCVKAIEEVQTLTQGRAPNPEIVAAVLPELRRRTDDALVRNLPRLPDIAKAADRFWLPRLPELEVEAGASWSALYSSLYRHLSGSAHPSPRSLAPIARKGRRFTIAEPTVRTAHNAVTTAPTVFALVLLTSRVVFGWPSEEGIMDAFNEGGRA